jgi:hypothetical protein
MDAVEFLKERTRMCNFYMSRCMNCPGNKVAYCATLCAAAIELVPIVEQWAKEHPVKTRQSELQKLFPDLTLEDGWFCMCPKYVGQKECIDGPVEKSTCDKCRRDFWLAEIKDGEE